MNVELRQPLLQKGVSGDRVLGRRLAEDDVSVSRPHRPSYDRSMRWACLVIALALLPVPLRSLQAPRSGLESFLVVRHARSDDISGWNDQYLDVVPEGDGAHVRLIRISLANRYCDRILVQAIERIVPHTTPRNLARQDLCALDPDQIERAIDEAHRGGVTLTEYSSTAVVATCGTRHNVLRFDASPTIDWKSLERRHSDFYDAGQLYYRVTRRVFKAIPFDPYEGKNATARWDTTGSAVVPYLRSGRFDSVLEDDFIEQLQSYTAPPSREVMPAELLERASLRLAIYDPVPIPVIMLDARIHGDARLRLHVDAQTGDVSDAEVLSTPFENKMFNDLVLPRVRRWRFEQGSIPAGSVDVTLRFEPRCGN